MVNKTGKVIDPISEALYQAIKDEGEGHMMADAVTCNIMQRVTAAGLSLVETAELEATRAELATAKARIVELEAHNISLEELARIPWTPITGPVDGPPNFHEVNLIIRGYRVSWSTWEDAFTHKQVEPSQWREIPGTSL